MASLVEYAHAVSASLSPACTPERRLLLAVLQQAIADLKAPLRKSADQQSLTDARRDRQSAAHWLFAERAPERVFSLDWLCEQVDLDAVDLRQRLARRYRRDLLAARREPVLLARPPRRIKELRYGHDTSR